MSERLKDWFLTSSDQQKMVFLAELSHEFTIHGRSFALDLTGDELARAFKGLNEFQHMVSQDIAHIGSGSNWHSSEELWQSLQKKASNYGLSAHLKQSLESLALHRKLQTTE